MTASDLTADSSAPTDGPLPSRVNVRALVRGELGVLIACLAGGVVLGALWALVGSAAIGATDADEQAAASDGTFALLGIGFGVVSALLLAVLPGHHQVVRASVALAGSVLGGFVGLAVGLLLGAPALRADGMVLGWPIMLGLVTTLRLLVVHLLGRE